MMQHSYTRLIYSVIFFGLIMSLIIVLRPKAVFRDDGTLRPFSTIGANDSDSDYTLIPFGAIVATVAIGSMLLFTSIDAAGAGGAGGSGAGGAHVGSFGEVRDWTQK